MSKSEWEKGTIKLPSAEWAPFKQALQKGMSVHILKDYELALKLHAEMTAQKKGKRGFDLRKALEAELSIIIPGRHTAYTTNYDKPKYQFGVIDKWEVERLLLGPKEPFTLQKPKKKDFAPYTSASLKFEGRNCTVELNNETREVTWDVEDGNWHVDEARDTPLGKLLFSLLEKVKWTRGSGGKIIGNDENNRDNSDYEGGGGNYVTNWFGPLGEPEYMSHPAFKKASASRQQSRR